MSAEKSGRYKAGVEERIERKERLELRNEVEIGETLKRCRGD